MIIRAGFIKQIRQKCELNSQSEITYIEECKWDLYIYIYIYMLKSHKLNCCIENACCDIVNDL